MKISRMLLAALACCALNLAVAQSALGAEDFIVKLANAPGLPALEPGRAVEIGWRAEDCRALVE